MKLSQIEFSRRFVYSSILALTMILSLLTTIASAASAVTEATSVSVNSTEDGALVCESRRGDQDDSTKSCPSEGTTRILTKSVEVEAKPEEVSETKQDTPPPQCNLYYAPSTIPDAGWGLYTAKDLKAEESLDAGIGDIIVPILDAHKTYPFRGNQRFLPWLAYVWPIENGKFYGSEKDAFPEIEDGQWKEDEGLSNADDLWKFYYPARNRSKSSISLGIRAERMNALTPGLAMHLNSHEEWDNVFFNYDSKNHNYGQILAIEENIDGEDGFKESSFGKEEALDLMNRKPRSSLRHNGFEVTDDLEAGSELFLYYGESYHEYLDNKRNSAQGFETLEEYVAQMDFSTVATEAEKRWLLNTTSMRLRTENNASFEYREELLGGTPKTEEEKLEVEEEGEEEVEDVDYGTEPPKRSLKWLQENGVCVDQLTVKDSMIAGAGKGAFAQRAFAKGQLVSHSPLLHLKKDDMMIYEVESELKPGRESETYSLNFDKVIAQELMLNYCFGHNDSEVLLFPYSPMVNYINHDGENPNSRIQWTDGSKTYFDLHPIEVLELHAGTLRMEYVALRDIESGEEITIDYGPAWAKAWEEYQSEKKEDKSASFRHAIGVPQEFYPDRWLHESVKYELLPKGDLKSGELKPLAWKHNGKPVARFAHRVGLPEGISKRFLEYSKDIGIIPTYSKILKDSVLGSDEWYVWNATRNSTGDYAGQWFAQRYKSSVWNFNMHYMSAWDETARKNFLGEVGRAGFDEVMDGIGNHFGLDNMTCFHLSYMGVSECDQSFMHTDVYASGEVSYNLIWPILLVDNSKPELNLQSDDGNLVIDFKYEYDTAVLMGDWGYHFTSEIEGYKGDEMRVVVGMYCGQMDNRNAKMYAHLYDGEDPAPFMGQFEEPYEYHWSKGNPPEHRLSRLTLNSVVHR